MSDGRQQLDGTGDGGAQQGGFVNPPNVGDELANASVAANVRVVHGVNEQSFPNLEGRTVGFVKKNLRDVFNIPSDAEALVNGQQVGDDFVLEGGNSLEFVKEAGVKG